MKRQHSCTLVLYFLYRCSTNICTRRIFILYKTDFERFAHFKCSQHSSFLLWKQMGVEGEDPENTALLSVLCYSADNSADIPDGGSCNEKGNPEGLPGDACVKNYLLFVVVSIHSWYSSSLAGSLRMEVQVLLNVMLTLPSSYRQQRRPMTAPSCPFGSLRGVHSIRGRLRIHSMYGPEKSRSSRSWRLRNSWISRSVWRRCRVMPGDRHR